MSTESRSRPLRDAALAVTLLTALPLPVRWPAERERPDVASWFALVGLGFGALALAGMAPVVRYLYGLSGLGVAVMMTLYALSTRLLHWDALADTADAWFVPRERRLDVMADSATGAFGAVAIALAVLIEWTALLELGSSQSSIALIVMVPVFGRLAATFSAWLGKPARPGGLGASVIRRPTATGVLVTLAAIAGAIAMTLWAGAAPLVVAVLGGVGLVLALGVPHLVALRMGGVTGDTMGASVQLVELTLLVAAAWLVSLLQLVGVTA